MKWCKKNLNLTFFIITFCSNIISYCLVKLYISRAHINPAGPIYPLHDKVTQMAFTSFGLDASLLLADVLIIAGACWFLAQKKRSFAFLLFFIAFLIFDLPLFLSYVFVIPSRITTPFWSIRIISIMLWIVGWIIVVALKNKSAPQVVPSLDGNHSSSPPTETGFKL